MTTTVIMNSTPRKEKQQASELALERWQVTNTDCIMEDESLECIARETVIVSKEVQPNLEVQVKGQDPLDEVNLGTKDEPKPTYVSAWLDPITRSRILEVLKEFKDCFAWDYSELPGLDRQLVEHKLPMKPDAKPIKQKPRRMEPKITLKVKEEVNRLLKARFIRTARYVEWISNIVPVMKKNEKLRVCIDFRSKYCDT